MKRVSIVVFVILLIGILNYTYVKADTKDELSGGISVEDFDLSEGSNVLRRNGYDEINIKEIMHTTEGTFHGAKQDEDAEFMNQKLSDGIY